MAEDKTIRVSRDGGDLPNSRPFLTNVGRWQAADSLGAIAGLTVDAGKDRRLPNAARMPDGWLTFFPLAKELWKR